MATKKEEAQSEQIAITPQDLVASVKAILEATQPAKVEDEPVKEDDGKLFMRNADGGMLECKMTLSRREGAPDPLFVCINEQTFAIKRGVEVTVPWYVVQALLLNVERRFHQEVIDGKRITVSQDMPAEPLSFSPINPAPGVQFAQPKLQG